MKILRGGGLRKVLSHKRGALKKLGGAPKIFILLTQKEGGRGGGGGGGESS